jgi:hypothetical protein
VTFASVALLTPGTWKEVDDPTSTVTLAPLRSVTVMELAVVPLTVPVTRAGRISTVDAVKVPSLASDPATRTCSPAARALALEACPASRYVVAELRTIVLEVPSGCFSVRLDELTAVTVPARCGCTTAMESIL